MWEAILWEREKAGEQVQIHWVPSHLGVQGNNEADALVEVGRQLHPDNTRSLTKRPRAGPMWDELGLEEMSSGGGTDASDSGVSSSEYLDSLSVTVPEANQQTVRSGPAGSCQQGLVWMSVTPARGGGGIIKSTSTEPKGLCGTMQYNV